MVEHATELVIAVTARSTLDTVLDQLREMPQGPVTIALDPLSVVFSTPDDFRALDGVRLAQSRAVTLAVNDPHRMGLALAFGYRVRPVGDGAAPRARAYRAAEAGPTTATDPIRVAPVVVGRPKSRRDTRDMTVRPLRYPWGARSALTAILLTMTLAGAALFIEWRVHTGTVIITPAEHTFSRVVPFAVSVVPTNDPNAIQTTIREVAITREGDAPATGKRTVPDGSATGTMTFRSRADGTTAIKAGTALKGPRDVSYTLLTDIVVPGLDFVRGQLGETSGRVRAVQPGPDGNLAAGFSARYTDNVTYISGDITGGTEKQVSVVTDEDIAGVRIRLESDLRMHALAEVNASLPSGDTALNDYLVLPPATTTSQPVAGAQAETVHVRVAVAAQMPVYHNADFDALIERRLTESVQAIGGEVQGAEEVLPATVTRSKPVFVDVQGPLVRYFATVTGKTRAIISDTMLQQMRGALTGKGDRGAAAYLSGNPSIQQARVTYGPEWLPQPLRKRMPRNAAHIRIRVESP